MNRNPLAANVSRLAVFSSLILVLIFGSSPHCHGQIETLLHSFTEQADGGGPVAGLLFDSTGNLYGTTHGGGDFTCYQPCGVVFELSPTSSGAWQETVLYSFNGDSDGAYPASTLISDTSGNLYGTTYAGGNVGDCYAEGCGTAFKLSRSAHGSWQKTTLYAFQASPDGQYPYAGLVSDQFGNLYGTTIVGGNSACTEFGKGCGTVFKLSPNSIGGWAETIIHSFTGGKDGAYPYAGVILDAAGNLYGTTWGGGLVNPACTWGCGVVYELSPNAGGGWTTNVLHTFTGGADGASSYAPLIFDSVGRLYGTTWLGGLLNNYICYSNSGCGVVFKLTKSPSGQWKETVIHAFVGGFDGGGPFAGVVFDSKGRLYGTTRNGGRGCIGYGCGVVFRLEPTSSGGWKGTTLTTFTGGYEGGEPQDSLILDAGGNLYGTASFGGIDVGGIVFEISQ